MVTGMNAVMTQKTELREAMRAATAALTPEDRLAQSEAACAHARALLEDCRRVLLYAAMPDELDVWPLAKWLLASDVEVGLPRVDWATERMEAGAFTGDHATLEQAGPGILQPRGDETLEIYEPGSIDVVVAPGLAFDRTGARLGRGGGYYDRFLGGLHAGVRCIGVGFEHQLVDRVPREPHDRMMGWIVTAGGAVEAQHDGDRR